jgi:putative peptide zinc metalloprotease protein
MTMLSKKRRLQSRCGFVALTIPMALSFTGTASAAVTSLTPANAQTYDNLAQASSQTNSYTDFNVMYDLEQSSAANVSGDNAAVATTSQCHDCGAVAVGFQILVVSKQANLNMSNTANATSAYCVRCTTLAASYQIVYATNSPQLSLDQQLALSDIRTELVRMQIDGLSVKRMETLTAEFADEAVAVLQGGHDTRNASNRTYSPDMPGFGLPAALTENNGPVTHLYIKYGTPKN